MQDDPPLTPHQKVIKRFGGIRPMASKLGHANHTTVQGWWNSSIPYKYWDEIAAAATRHNVPFAMTDLLPAEAA